MESLLKNWTIMRIIRLVLGMAALGQAIWLGDIFLGLLAVFLLGTAVMNIGCCAGNCAVPGRPSSENTKIRYEEMDNK